VINPDHQQLVPSSTLYMSTHDEAGRLIDLFDITHGKMEKSEDLHIYPNDLTGAGASLNDYRAGETTDGSITAKLRNALPPRGVVIIVFPLGFALPTVPTAMLRIMPSTASDADRHALGPSSLNVTGSMSSDGKPQLMLQVLSGAALPKADAQVTVLFFGVTVPCWEQITPSFAMRTTTAEGFTVDVLDTAAAKETELRVRTNLITEPHVELLNPTTGALTDATITFRVFNAVPAGGAVRITFPSGFSFYGPATGAAFAGSVVAFSTGLEQNGGDPLDAVLGGGSNEMADDSVVHVFRDVEGLPVNDSCFALGATCADCLISVTLSNVRVPLGEGLMGPFEIVTLTKQGATIDVLELHDPGRYVAVSYAWYAPTPPPPDSSPAATHGGTGDSAWLAVVAALLLHRLERWTCGA